MRGIDVFAMVARLRNAIYGQVALVRHRRSHILYAMKVMSLTHMAAQRAVSGPCVSEDGEAELRILRRLSEYNRMGARERSAQPLVTPQPMDPVNAALPDHHHILTLHADFIDPRLNARCLVFEYCPYGELSDQLRAAPTGATSALSIPAARSSFTQIATAVQFLHARNIAHRDLSLENILVDARKQCRLSDFGLASETGHACQGRVGKAFYMAPEVYACTEDEVYDGLCADMWSLGVILFILVTGAPPWAMPCDKDARFRLFQREGVLGLVQLWRLENVVSPDLCAFLTGLLCVEPTKRLAIDQVWRTAWLVHSDESKTEDQKLPFMPSLLVGDGAAGSDIDNGGGAPPTKPTKRLRKRMKISIDASDGHGAATNAAAPPPGGCISEAGDTVVDESGSAPSETLLSHDSPCAHGAAPAPRASPVMWPRSRAKVSQRSLFQQPNDVVNKTLDGDALTGDVMAPISQADTSQGKDTQAHTGNKRDRDDQHRVANGMYLVDDNGRHASQSTNALVASTVDPIESLSVVVSATPPPSPTPTPSPSLANVT